VDLPGNEVLMLRLGLAKLMDGELRPQGTRAWLPFIVGLMPSEPRSTAHLKVTHHLKISAIKKLG